MYRNALMGLWIELVAGATSEQPSEVQLVSVIYKLEHWEFWSEWQDSNLRELDPKSSA